MQRAVFQGTIIGLSDDGADDIREPRIVRAGVFGPPPIIGSVGVQLCLWCDLDHLFGHVVGIGAFRRPSERAGLGGTRGPGTVPLNAVTTLLRRESARDGLETTSGTSTNAGEAKLK